MTIENKKKLIKVTTYLADNNSFSYEGRLLGLISDREFNVLVRNKTVQTRCLTKQTIPLANIVASEAYGGFDGLGGLRMVMAIKKREGIDCYTKALFVTDRLTWISYVQKEQTSAAFCGEDNSWLTVDEEEV